MFGRDHPEDELALLVRLHLEVVPVDRGDAGIPHHLHDGEQAEYGEDRAPSDERLDHRRGVRRERLRALPPPDPLRSGDRIVSVLVTSSQTPGRAGIDPDHVLLDRKAEENVAVGAARAY